MKSSTRQPILHLGGGYIVIGAGPVIKDDKEGAPFLATVNGKRLELISALAYAFHKDPDLADIAKHALLFGGLVSKYIPPKTAQNDDKEQDTDTAEPDTDPKE